MAASETKTRDCSTTLLQYLKMDPKKAQEGAATFYLGEPHVITDVHDFPSPASIINKSAAVTGVSVIHATAFDKEWHNQLELQFRNAGVYQQLQDYQSSGRSNGRPLLLQVMSLPPNKYFSIHAHPNIEFECTLYGSLHEYRLVTNDNMCCLPLSTTTTTLRGPSPKGPDVAVTDTFVYRSVTEGQCLCNEIGSLHQSFTTKNEGCSLLVLWSGCHAKTHPSRVFVVDERLRPRAGWEEEEEK